MKNQEELEMMRHSASHIMAAAVKRLWPDAKFGIGPSVDNGFYYDIDFNGRTISVDELKKVESEMKNIVNEDLTFEKEMLSAEEAIKWAKDNSQPYKLELIEGLIENGEANDGLSFYKVGDFTDLCRGPHLASTGKVGPYKLLKVAGAYWKGDEHREQMQRLYGLAFFEQVELDNYLKNLEEAKQRDHRKLGKELDLFTTSELVGSGLPMFTPRGTVLRDCFANYSKELREQRGFQQVWTPHITKIDLYKKSGHWDKFGEELFLVKSQETSDQFALKPMNCPHHTQIYASQPRSYRNLPIRYMEVTTDYRDEKTGELGGLSRVRALTQDDSHIFCRDDQIETEILSLLEVAEDLYHTIGMSLRVRLSYRDDSDAYLGEMSVWVSAQAQLKSAVEKVGLDFFEQEGEAAFYGPKIDFMATDAIGREHQVATVQLDFVQPQRFELEYTDDSGNKRTPIMIHCAILGSLERFLSVYIEHTAGKFPVWCSPEQLRIIKVKDSPEVDEFVYSLQSEAFDQGIRTVVDDSNNSVSKKIRAAETLKVPYTVVIGDKEVDTKKMPLRIRGDLVSNSEAEHVYSKDQLISSIANESKSRVSRSSL